MKIFKYVEPHEVTDEPVTVYMTEQDILDEYWDYWKEQMRNRLIENGDVSNETITHENCIEDFCTIHWAEEVKGIEWLFARIFK